MGKSFRDYFEESMNSVGVPPPKTGFTLYADAVKNTAYLIGALKTVRRGATVSEIVAAVRGVNTAKVFALPVAGEIIVTAAGLGGAFYIGVLTGAIVYAAGNCAVDAWDDRVFSQPDAVANAKNLAAVGNSLGAMANPSAPISDANSQSANSCQIPANSCCSDSQPINYSPSWPTQTMCF
jgi:hypothetical protein